MSDELWQLRIDDLSGLGGMMGTETIRHIKSRVFISLAAAKAGAAADHEQRTGRVECLQWRPLTGRRGFRADCGGEGYTVAPITVED